MECFSKSFWLISRMIYWASLTIYTFVLFKSLFLVTRIQTTNLRLEGRPAKFSTTLC